MERWDRCWQTGGAVRRTIREAGIIGACGAWKKIKIYIYKNAAQFFSQIKPEIISFLVQYSLPCPIPQTPGILLLRRLDRNPVNGFYPGAVGALPHVTHRSSL